MIQVRSVWLLLLLPVSSLVWSADCVLPTVPDIPDGASADMDAMLEGKQAVTAFQTANSEYLGCLDLILDSHKAKIAAGQDEAIINAANQEFEKVTEQYNMAVDAEEKLANKFNDAIRVFKPANPT